MQSIVSTDINEIIRKTPFLPAVTIVIPFNPKMDTSKHLHEFIAFIKQKVNDLVFETYQDDLSLLVLQKLNKILRSLNSATQTESLAIFLSPVFEKVLYLNYPVETYVGIDESFSIEQVVLSRKKSIKYMLLDFTVEHGRVCLGNEHSLILLKRNSTTFQSNAEIFFKVDQEMGILMEAYKVPVFVIGKQSQLAYYQANTMNSKYMVRYITENKTLNIQGLFQKLRLYFTEWDVIVHQFRKNMLKEAQRQGLLACGMHNVSTAVKEHKPVDLYISEVFARQFNSVSAACCRTKGEKYYNQYSYVKNKLDELIESVVESRGNVNYIKDDVCEGFHQICLIYK